MNKESNLYSRTDLAVECRARDGADFENMDGIAFQEERLDSITVSHLIISTSQAAGIIGKPIGKYVTIGFIHPNIMTDEQIQSLENTLCGVIREFIYRLCPHCHSVLAVGLGNIDITADSIGPRCISNITVTRHIKEALPDLFKKLCRFETSAIVPGVSGQTGFESSGLILSAVKIANPDLVIAIDALAARSPDRLTCTIQLCDSGIAPGSGVKNHRTAINKELLGIPVIALGVPTVVDSSTLIFDTLEKSGVEHISDELKNTLENNRNYYVSPKEIDAAVKILCPIISRALDSALSMEN